VLRNAASNDEAVRRSADAVSSANRDAFSRALAVEVRHGSCYLVSATLNLSFRVTNGSAKIFLHFTTAILGGAGDTIFVYSGELIDASSRGGAAGTFHNNATGTFHNNKD
jgi:hypothetical protein